MMDIRIQTQGFSLTPAIGAWVHEQLNKSLDRYSEDVLSVEVYLKDVNGPKGGDDKQALAQIRLRYRAPVMIESTHGDLYAAIDLTARRARRAVRRALDRRNKVARGDTRRIRMIQALAGEL